MMSSDDAEQHHAAPEADAWRCRCQRQPRRVQHADVARHSGEDQHDERADADAECQHDLDEIFFAEHYAWQRGHGEHDRKGHRERQVDGHESTRVRRRISSFNRSTPWVVRSLPR
mgnify:CR=1 FL=1